MATRRSWIGNPHDKSFAKKGDSGQIRGNSDFKAKKGNDKKSSAKKPWIGNPYNGSFTKDDGSGILKDDLGIPICKIDGGRGALARPELADTDQKKSQKLYRSREASQRASKAPPHAVDKSKEDPPLSKGFQGGSQSSRNGQREKSFRQQQYVEHEKALVKKQLAELIENAKRENQKLKKWFDDELDPNRVVASEGVSGASKFNPNSTGKDSRAAGKHDFKTREANQPSNLSIFSKLPAMVVLEKEYAKVGLEPPNLEETLQKFADPPDLISCLYGNVDTEESRSRPKSRKAQNNLLTQLDEDLWGLSWDPNMQTKQDGVSNKTFKSDTSRDKSHATGGLSEVVLRPESNYNPPTVEDHNEDHPDNFSLHEADSVTLNLPVSEGYRQVCQIMTEIIDKLFPSLEVRLSPIDLDLERVERLFKDESYPRTLSRMNLALKHLMTVTDGESFRRFFQLYVWCVVDSNPPTPQMEKIALQWVALQLILRGSERNKALLNELQTDGDLEMESDSESAGDEQILKERTLLWGRRRIEEWKASAGRAKDWKQCHSVKALTKRKRACCDRVTTPLKAVKVRLRGSGQYDVGESKLKQPDLPVAAIRSYEARLPKFSNLKTRYIKVMHSHARATGKRRIVPQRCLSVNAVDMISDAADDRNYEQLSSTSSCWLDEANRTRDQWRTARNLRRVAGLDPADWPLTLHRPGELLCYPYRLMEHIRTEHHGEVYNLEDMDSGMTYEVKIYTLRGVDPRQRKNRVNNLKTSTSQSSFVRSFDYGGHKYCLFQHPEPRIFLPPPQLKAVDPAKGREYKAAFPELPQREVPKICPHESRTSQSKTDFPNSAIQSDSYPSTCSQDENSVDVSTRQIILEELNSSSHRWQALPMPLPLALRIMVRLGEMDYDWKDYEYLLEDHPHETQGSVTAGQKRRRRRTKKTVVAK